MSVEDWDKMKCIFAEDHYIFYEFVVCAIAIFEYATTFARKMELLYSVLNSRIHEYVEIQVKFPKTVSKKIALMM